MATDTEVLEEILAQHIPYEVKMLVGTHALIGSTIDWIMNSS